MTGSHRRQPRPAVFLDRDGTVNAEREYLHRIADFAFLPGVPEAIRRLRAAGYPVFVITNQSGVARGFFSLADVDRLHRHLQQELAARGTRIDGFYVCPHHPAAGAAFYRRDCDCRKGRPGLLLRAAREHALRLAGSFMIGDKASDLEAGRRAGCTSLLVLTGYGAETAAALADPSLPVFAGLPAAADYILGLRRSGDGAGRPV